MDLRWSGVGGRELKQVKGRKGWAGWMPRSEEETKKFRSRVICPEGPRAWLKEEDCGGLEMSQDWWRL